MNEWIVWATEIYNTYRPAVYLAAGLAAVALLSLTGWQVWSAYHGRTFSARASLGFAVVQTGVAYVTITGVYGFWTHRVDLPPAEAALFAAFIEAVTWAAVGMIFAHGAEPGTTGAGPAGPLFWGSVVGGGVMAVVGSPSLAVATGRTVVVVLGAMMWHLRIRQRTRRATERKATRWTITPRQLLLRSGWLIADDGDVVQSPWEWRVRQLARAVRRSADGNLLTRRLGQRAIQRVMESGDTQMVREARHRYALGRVLQDDLSPDSESMARSIEAARAALYPSTPPPPPDNPEPSAPDKSEPPKRRPAGPRRTAPNSRTAAAMAARSDATAAQELRATAVSWAIDRLRTGRILTGAAIAAEFDRSEEWGRKRLGEARDRLYTPNGDGPSAVA